MTRRAAGRRPRRRRQRHPRSGSAPLRGKWLRGDDDGGDRHRGGRRAQDRLPRLPDQERSAAHALEPAAPAATSQPPRAEPALVPRRGRGAKIPSAQLRLNAHNSAAAKRRISHHPRGDPQRARRSIPRSPRSGSDIQTEYHGNQRAIVERLHERRHLRPELDVGQATDILWAINHPNTWQLLVVDRRWTPDDYERWTGDLARAQLLAYPRRTAGRRDAKRAKR